MEGLARDDMANLRAGGPIPCHPRRVADDRCALVGDAAGYVEPCTGEGMACAIQGAHVLRGVLEGVHPGTWNERLAQRYQIAWRNRIAARQRWCSMIAFALQRPSLFNLLIRLGRGRQSLAQRLVDQVVTA